MTTGKTNRRRDWRLGEILGCGSCPAQPTSSVIGLDIAPPKTEQSIRFIRMDLGTEIPARRSTNLFKERAPFPWCTWPCDRSDAYWSARRRSYVADQCCGTARVMEAITEANRNEDSGVRQFIFRAGVSSLWPRLARPCHGRVCPGGTHPALRHSQARVRRSCASSVRPRCAAAVPTSEAAHFRGATVENYLLGAFRGACLLCASSRALAFSVGVPRKSSEQVILYGSSRENVRPQNVGTAAAQRGRTLLHQLRRIFACECVGQGVCPPGQTLP